MLNYHLKYNPCGCDGNDHICKLSFCQTVDCSGSQVIPYGYSGAASGEPHINNGIQNTSPIKYKQAATCVLSTTINGITSTNSYFNGLNGIFKTRILAPDTLETITNCAFGEVNDNRHAIAIISFFLSGPDGENPYLSVSDILIPESSIYTPFNWTGQKPTVWMKVYIDAGIGFAADGGRQFSAAYTLIGNTNVTYSGDYVRTGSNLSVPSMDCGVNINTGNIDGTKLNLTASTFTIKDSTLGGVCHTDDIDTSTRFGFDFSSMSINVVKSNSIIDYNEYQLDSQGLGEIELDPITDYGNLKGLRTSFNTSGIGKLTISGVIDERNITPFQDRTLATCDCSGYLNRTHRLVYSAGDYILSNTSRPISQQDNIFNELNNDNAVADLCCCNEDTCVDNIIVDFYKVWTTAPFCKTASKVLFRNGTTTLAEFYKDYNNIGSGVPAKLSYSELADVEHTFVSQNAEMATKCNLSGASVKFTIEQADESAPCITDEGCPYVCGNIPPEIEVDIPTFTLTRFTNFSSYYIGSRYIFPVVDPVQVAFNAKIDEWAASCPAGDYTFPGGTYVLQNVNECTWRYTDADLEITLTMNNAETISITVESCTLKFTITPTSENVYISDLGTCCVDSFDIITNCIVDVGPYGYQIGTNYSANAIWYKVWNTSTCEFDTTGTVFVEPDSIRYTNISCYIDTNINIGIRTL